MGLLTAVEHHIDALVRRVFPKRSGDGVQPVEIAREMVKAMESRRALSVDAVYVPNVYRAAVHSGDFAELLPVMNTVERDAASYLERVAEKRGLSFTGPVRLEIEPDDALEPGRVVVTARFEEAEDERPDQNTIDVRPSQGGAPAPWADSATKRYAAAPSVPSRTTASDETSPGAAWLEVTSGPEAGRRLRLDAARHIYVIGRVEGADLVLSDNRVSKRHAELRFEGGEWWLVDLDSTNGTRKNGRSIAREVLADGDEVAVGLTTLRFNGMPERTRIGLERA